MNVTMKRISILLLLMVSIFTAVADSPVSLYEKWKNKPAKELMNMGIKLFAETDYLAAMRGDGSLDGCGFALIAVAPEVADIHFAVHSYG